MRRFWKTVAVEHKLDGALRREQLRLTFAGQYGVLLDKRTLRTPGGLPLTLSVDRLPVIVLIAEEWENQVAVLKPHTLPMVRSSPVRTPLSYWQTSIASRALDALHDESLRAQVVTGLLKYLDTDTVWCVPTLVELLVLRPLAASTRNSHLSSCHSRMRIGSL